MTRTRSKPVSMVAIFNITRIKKSSTIYCTSPQIYETCIISTTYIAYVFNHHIRVAGFRQCDQNCCSQLSQFNHHSTVIWASCNLKSPTNQLFVQTFVQAYNKENNEAPYYCLFVKGIRRWIPLTKGSSLHKGQLMRTGFLCDDVRAAIIYCARHFSTRIVHPVRYAHGCVTVRFVVCR